MEVDEKQLDATRRIPDEMFEKNIKMASVFYQYKKQHIMIKGNICEISMRKAHSQSRGKGYYSVELT